MKWPEIEQNIIKYPKSELCAEYSVHRIKRFLRVPELNYSTIKLTAPQYMRASAYFENRPAVYDKDKNTGGVFEIYMQRLR